MTPFSLRSFLVGLVIGVVLSAAWFLGGSETLSKLAQHAEPVTPPVLADPASDSGAIVVHDQSAGDSVAVESLTVPAPGVWVAVRDVTGGDLGNVLGAQFVSGPRTNVMVDLLRATVPGTEYAIELFRDNGDGVFDLSTDSVYVDFSTGERVVAYFTAH